MIRTFSTRPVRRQDRKGAVLAAYADLMGKAERKIHAWLKAGKDWTAEEYGPLYRELGLSAAHFRMARASLDGKLKSIVELAKLRVGELEGGIATKEKQISTKKGAITKARNRIKALEPKISKCESQIVILQRNVGAAKTEAKKQRAIASLKQQLDKRQDHLEEMRILRARIKRNKVDNHQHVRKSETLRHKLERAREAASDPSICFGTKSLFLKQFELEANGLLTMPSGDRNGTRQGNQDFSSPAQRHRMEATSSFV